MFCILTAKVRKRIHINALECIKKQKEAFMSLGDESKKGTDIALRTYRSIMRIFRYFCLLIACFRPFLSKMMKFKKGKL